MKCDVCGRFVLWADLLIYIGDYAVCVLCETKMVREDEEE